MSSVRSLPTGLHATLSLLCRARYLAEQSRHRSHMPAAVHRPRAALTLLAALLMVWAWGGGGGAPRGVTTPPDVAAFIVPAPPATTMLIGESATLVATATNASGGVISGPNVT